MRDLFDDIKSLGDIYHLPVPVVLVIGPLLMTIGMLVVLYVSSRGTTLNDSQE